MKLFSFGCGLGLSSFIFDFSFTHFASDTDMQVDTKFIQKMNFKYNRHIIN